MGGRLAMMLLAATNPGMGGLTSDDGFMIGRFTLLGSLNLLLVGGLLGALGAVVYAALRGLVVGPTWFRVLSVGVGPAVVVGEQLVHTDGVDYRLLGNPGLGVALFMLIPGVYAALLTLLAERWLTDDGFFARRPLGVALLPLAALVPLVPLVVGLALVWVAVEALRRRHGGAVPGASVAAWVGRGALGVVFVVALARLVDEARWLLG
ncbi:hypothetical protein G7072_17300 [Nocardioides sp. HDW12B]|uniref:hypothetical protein n=1 Tax=Nocardioides sp. HDW12B TaxID=2714939 RepID=UPI001407E919|nr:hypothetical protein [Nocardioides sp. HDW12B]QIK67868.1 hypothetical protein G7072_17300 [Nocardioides sp. HDW12B]